MTAFRASSASSPFSKWKKGRVVCPTTNLLQSRSGQEWVLTGSIWQSTLLQHIRKGRLVMPQWSCKTTLRVHQWDENFYFEAQYWQLRWQRILIQSGWEHGKLSGSCLNFYPLWGQVLRLEVLIWGPRIHAVQSDIQDFKFENTNIISWNLCRQEIVQQIWAPARMFLIRVLVSEATFGIKDLPTFSNMIANSGFKSSHWIISTNLASLHTIVFWWQTSQENNRRGRG